MLLIFAFVIFTLNKSFAEPINEGDIPQNLTRNYEYLCQEAYKESNNFRHCFFYNVLNGISGGIFNDPICQIETYCYDKNCKEVYTFLDYTHLKNIKGTVVCSNGKFGMYNCERGPFRKECKSKPLPQPPTEVPQPPPSITPSNCEALAKCSDANPQEANLIPDYCDCHKFYQCQRTQDGGWIKYLRDCPLSMLVRDYNGRLFFNSKLKVCDWDPSNAAGICRK